MPKQARNAFFYFMLDFKKKEERNGKTFLGGLKDVAKAADSHWKKLSKEDKEPYEERARAEKEGTKVNNNLKFPEKSSGKERYTSLGIPLSRIQQEEQDQEEKVRVQREKVDSIIQFGIDNNLLLRQPFYLLTFNYFVRNPKDNYMPCELGLIKFSFEKGVSEKLHSLMNPGKLPSGFAYSAMIHAKDTHQLPLPPKALGTTDFVDIMYNIKEFVEDEHTVKVSKRNYIFVMEDEEKMIENILEGLCDEAQMDTSVVQLLPLTYFFQKLRISLEDLMNVKTEKEFTDATAQIYFERDLYRYNKGNGCDLHEKEMNFHCAVSRVTRWAYVILNQTMDLAGVSKKLPGHHFPMQFVDAPMATKVADTGYDDFTTETESVTTETDTASVVTVSSAKPLSDAQGLNDLLGAVGVTKKLNKSFDLDSSFSRLNLFEKRQQQARIDQPLDQSIKAKLFESFTEDARETERASESDDSDTASVATVTSQQSGFTLGFDDTASTASSTQPLFRKGKFPASRGNFRQGRLIRQGEQVQNPFTMFETNLEENAKNTPGKKRSNIFAHREKQAQNQDRSKIDLFKEQLYESFYESSGAED